MRQARVDLVIEDGTLDLHTFHPEGAGPWPAVIVYMEAFGLRPNIASMAERLASHGYFVALPNLYYRSGGFKPFDPRQVAVEGPERARFKGMIASIDGTMVMRDTSAVIAWVDSTPRAR